MATNNSREKRRAKLEVGPLPLGFIQSEPEAVNPNVVSLLVFEMGGQPFAIGVEQTEGVVDCPRLSPLPSPPDGIIGITSVRGRMTLVMDLSLKENIGEEKRRLILVKGDAQLGLLAERVEGVVAMEPEKLQQAPPLKPSDEESRWPAQAYFKSAGHLVPVIDIERLIEL